jgi:membrane-associated protease RseP (regulator of RpoE activity)
MTYLAAIAVLALLIVVHELGHFLAARLQGIHVNRFSIGFGPVLWKYQGPQTEYALRAIPLGGYVGFPDDEPESEFKPNDPNLLRNRPVLDRAIVISAGVIANLIFAYFVFVVQFGGVGIPTFSPLPGVIVPEIISTDSPAAIAGMKPGDVIVAVDGKPLGTEEAATQSLMAEIKSHANQPLDLRIKRGDGELSLSVTPKPNEKGTPLIGVSLAPNGSQSYERPESFGQVLTFAAKTFQKACVDVAQGFLQLVTNFSKVANQVAGPVKIVSQGADLAATDITMLFPFTALISINLAIINILPLPALDGGQLVFLLLEALRGKPLPNRLQENVMQTGLVLLLGLGIFLIVRDTTQEFFPQFRK